VTGLPAERSDPEAGRVAALEAEVNRLTTAVQALEGRLAAFQRGQLEAERFLARQHLEHFSLWSQYHLFAQLNTEESAERQATIRECVEHIRLVVAEYDHEVWHSDRPLDEADAASQLCRKFCIDRDIPLGV
jgi:hypothetical protein